VPNLPDGALPLAYLGCPFAIDGERLTGEQAGHFVAFDLLAWNGKDVKAQPFSERIATLEEALRSAGLIPYGTPACAPLPVTGQYPDNLTLVLPETDPQRARALLAWLGEQNREGVIARQMDASYELGDARYTKKFKFLAEIDGVVIGVKPGIATGSVSLGLIRRADGAMIDVGSVRSGLRDADIEGLAQMLREGKYPVLKVTYLPIRTVGIKLVEPRTSIRELRGDKLANECFADQLGPDKAALIAAESGTPFLDAAGAIIRVRAERDVFWA
jgi:ATP-dependent DNA ligase